MNVKKNGSVSLIAITIAGLGFAIPATAAPITYSYTTNIGFDPTGTIGAGGQNASQLVDELFGPGIGSTGSATLTGSFTYDNTTPQFDGNSRSAGYADAITNATVNFDSTNTAQANIDTIRNNLSSSSVGFNALSNGGFCGGQLVCESVGIPFVPTGNMVQVVNDTNFQITGPDGTVQFTPRDALSFSLGGTDSDEDFSPAISTDTFGDVFVNSVGVTLISEQSLDFFDSVALPENLSFLDNTNLQSSIFSIDFSGPNIPGGFSLEGILAAVENGGMDGDGGGPNQPPAVSVPEPGSLGILTLGLLGLLGFKARQSRKS
ncbi:PEP-CTERM sorting domain-containing protein [Marinobacter sp. ATCH36]|uniref:PEP-CTERM sorting domain-containing protein n=1 Tax=Marinobacter sp. ATCH36 TaxID=2945106 RepID=UPI002021F9B1|nr:PEP-CTERM sorting domain-containing protein [Marinobacter sp. ATCH36]MCL7944661.1 PEP-CTERM sorting domain-containing protein [Marinobacter sp. ATCH36]